MYSIITAASWCKLRPNRAHFSYFLHGLRCNIKPLAWNNLRLTSNSKTGRIGATELYVNIVMSESIARGTVLLAVQF